MSIQVADNFSYLGEKPLDARLKYDSVATMKAMATASLYDGCLAYVVATKKYYTFDSSNDVDETLGKWRELETGGGSGIDNVVEGYLNPSDGGFYENYNPSTQTYSDLITGAADIIYIDKNTNHIFRYNTLSFKYDELEETPQKKTMPPANDYHRNKIYQYTGETTQDFIKGYYYVCSENPSTYLLEWKQINVQPDDNTVIQVTVMPAATSALNGTVYQFIGATAGNYTQGYFYLCTEDTDNPGTYIWIQLDTQPDEDTKIQVSTMPAVTSADEGKIVQFIGDTTGSYVNGYFYKCVEDPDNTGSYIWIQKNIQPDNDTQIQVSTMPSPIAILEDKIVQYVGATDSNYTNGYFYKCVEDTETPGTYKWEAVSVQAGGSGGGTLGKAITAQLDVGGIAVNDSFAVGTSYDDMWDALLNPVFYPTYDAPSATLTYSVSSPMEVGATIAAKTATVGYNAGAIKINGVKKQDRGGAATGYAIATSGADTEYSDSSASSGSFSIPALTRSTKGTLTITGTVSYAQGPQPKDSKGNDYGTPLAAGSATKSTSVTFILPYYYGKTSGTSISDFTGLTKDVTAKGQKAYKFTTNNEHMVIAYDKTYGDLKSILDPNSFEVISGWTKSTLTVGGFDYYVWIANSATTDTNAQFTFKY